MAQDVGRSFSLRQIREIDRVRYLAPEIEIDAITFATGSARHPARSGAVSWLRSDAPRSR
jgi:hypothetical protein